MVKMKIEDLGDFDSFVSKLRLAPYSYAWGTVKNYVITLGRLCDCAHAKKVMISP
jgi:hypothetical protein